MKTATVREVRQNFGHLLSFINSGEEVLITLHRKIVAKIVPALPEKRKKPCWPDFRARQRKLFGNQVLPGSIVAKERESYRW